MLSCSMPYMWSTFSSRLAVVPVRWMCCPPRCRHGTADQHVRHALVTMQVAVRHVACPENQCVIEQARIAIGSRLQLREKRRQALHMVSVNLGPILDNSWPFTMM